jgi:flagellar biosynthesis/type III secretory pathway ATPase
MPTSCWPSTGSAAWPPTNHDGRPAGFAFCHRNGKATLPIPEQAPLGVIEEVHGPVIDILCSRLPPLHQAVYVCLDGERYTFEVHRHLDESRARAIALHRTAGLRRLLPVFDSGGPLQIPVTPDCLGRLLDLFGHPLDGGPALASTEFRPIVAAPAPCGVPRTRLRCLPL